MNLLELIKSIKGLKCRDNTRQRATKPIDALELESPLDTCRLAGKSCRTASQLRKQSAYWQLVKAYCVPFLKRFFVLSKPAAKMLWRNAIYGQTVEEDRGRDVHISVRQDAPIASVNCQFCLSSAELPSSLTQLPHLPSPFSLPWRSTRHSVVVTWLCGISQRQM